ncbi:hypothetical protein JTB14_031634 [Gonioctena quinquepunctata]|nr:hypothetical protein JTB14_031634 [Gonioctena quinquepunctata]
MQKKDLQRQRTTSCSKELTKEQLRSSVARVLHSTFKEPSETRLYLPETTAQLEENSDMSLRDVISSAIMEILSLIVNGGNPFKDLVQTSSDIYETASVGSFSASPQNISPSPSPAGSCPIPLLTMKTIEETNQSPATIAMNFLMDTYNRVGVEERNHPKRSSIPPLSDLLTELRAQVIHYTTLIVQGYIISNVQKQSHHF